MGAVDPAADLKQALKQIEFSDLPAFVLQAFHCFAQELLKAKLVERYEQFDWFVSTVSSCAVSELHDLLYEIDQRINLDEEFQEAVSFDPDRLGIFFAMAISFVCRFMSASLDPQTRPEDSSEQAVRGKLEMALLMAQSSYGLGPEF